jgi:uncharacterized protein YegL
MMKEISKVIVLVEDRINEILESGDLKIELISDGLPTDKFLDTTEKFRFLKKLSKDLANFDIGRY